MFVNLQGIALPLDSIGIHQPMSVLIVLLAPTIMSNGWIPAQTVHWVSLPNRLEQPQAMIV